MFVIDYDASPIPLILPLTQELAEDIMDVQDDQVSNHDAALEGGGLTEV